MRRAVRKRTISAHVFTALNLKRRTPGSSHRSRGIHDSLLSAFLKCSKRQINVHESSIISAADRLPMQDHHVESNPERRWKAVKGHSEAIAHQHYVTMSIN